MDDNQDFGSNLAIPEIFDVFEQNSEEFRRSEEVDNGKALSLIDANEVKNISSPFANGASILIHSILFIFSCSFLAT